MNDGYIYEFVTKWAGLRIRGIKVDPISQVILWEGPWRWRHHKALEDSMSHAFVAFSALFSSEDKI